MALLTAGLLRFLLLDQYPPGLYRDEAFNGLDALGVLEGRHALFFAANNGREPLYIYLTALAVGAFGPSIFAVRVAAAAAGTLTTLVVYLLGKSWFGWRPALLAGWLWAITLWPVHLSRVGLRPILLAPLLGLAFWLGTLAYRRRRRSLWLLSGLVYGLTFYTYLAARFTPLLLVFLALYLWLTNRGRRLWPGAAWFAAGTLVMLLPLAGLVAQDPAILLGRSGQVSILHPDVNGGDFWGTLARHIAAAGGMFLWQGDTILRHNPAGRPVFDLFMAVPFVLGLVWSVRRWRRPPAMTVLLWVAVMLGPTILAADAPHFLRASGVWPALIYLPALGLAWLWNWRRSPAPARTALVVVLISGSAIVTWRDYTAYAQNPTVGYYFEAAATELAEEVNAEDAETEVLIDERFWSAWPSISFLVDNERPWLYDPADFTAADTASLPAAIYAWPYGDLAFVPQVLGRPVAVTVEEGPLTRGDLEETPYTLYLRYSGEELPAERAELARYGNHLALAGATAVYDGSQVQVELLWQGQAVEDGLVAFVHVLGADGLLAQSDQPPGSAHWRSSWWDGGLTVRERRQIALPEPYDPQQHRLVVGVYRREDGQRLAAVDPLGQPLANDVYVLRPVRAAAN